MKTIVLQVICSGCLQEKDCVGTGEPGTWFCEACAKDRDFPRKSTVLESAGWIEPNEKKHIFRIDISVHLTRTYEIEAQDEEEAREKYKDGDLVEEYDDYEEIGFIDIVQRKV
jgi:hypothetical protein